MQAPSLAADSTPVVAAVEDSADVEELPEEPMTNIDMMPADISCKPPAVSVTLNGEPINAEEPKTASQAFTPAPAQVRILQVLLQMLRCSLLGSGSSNKAWSAVVSAASLQLSV